MRLALASETCGRRDGEPLVLLHGFMGSRRDWDPLVSALGNDYACLLVDLPGHGASRISGDAASGAQFHDVAEAVGRLAHKTFPNGCNLLGYSMGGRLALYVALRGLAPVEKLVLESATPGIDDAGERTLRHEQDEQWARELESLDYAVFLRRWYAMPLFRSLDEQPALLSELFARRMTNNPKQLARAMRIMGTGSQESLWPALGKMPCPLLLITGERDVTYRHIADKVARTLGAQHVRIQDAGHVVHLEQPEEFARPVRHFLGA